MSKIAVQGDAAGTGTTTIKSKNTNTSTTFELPDTDGTNGQALITNGSGALSFGTIPTGGDYVLQTFTAPGTWSKPTGLKAVKVTVVGGGGVSRSDDGANTLVAVGTSSFGAFVSATAGANGISVFGSGGSGSSGDLNITGGTGTFSAAAAAGGNSVFSTVNYQPGQSAGLNYGGGAAFTFPGGSGGGGGGGAAMKWIPAPSIPGPVTVTRGAGGTTSGPAPFAPQRSGNGGAGVIIVEEFY